MAKLTKSEFERYDPNTLTGCADRLKNIVDGLGHGADDAGSAQKNAENNFQGTAADAINEQATTDIGALHQAHDAVEGLRSAYANGAQALTPSVNALREAQRSATQQGFTIEDNWQLRDDQHRSGMGRTMVQHSLQEQIDGAVTALDQADEQVSGDISKAQLALTNTPFPQIAVDYTPTPEQSPAQPDQSRPDDHPQDQGELGSLVPGAQGDPIALAESHKGEWTGDLKKSGQLPMNPNVDNTVCCSNFVTAALQKAGKIDFHQDYVPALYQQLSAKGWKPLPPGATPPAGAVAIIGGTPGSAPPATGPVDTTMHHVELVKGADANGHPVLIGSNNTGKGGNGPQQISEDTYYGNQTQERVIYMVPSS